MTQPGAARLSVAAAVMAMGAIGATLAMLGVGVPLPTAAVLAGLAAGLAQFGFMRLGARPDAADPGPDGSAAAALAAQLAECRAHAAALRHDMRGILSPAMMVSDRLLTHDEASVSKAGQIVVRSIERAAALLESNRDVMAGQAAPAAPAAAQDGLAAPR